MMLGGTLLDWIARDIRQVRSLIAKGSFFYGAYNSSSRVSFLEEKRDCQRRERSENGEICLFEFHHGGVVVARLALTLINT